MAKQDKYTKSARGQLCTVRIPGICNHNPKTTQPAHVTVKGLHGTATKMSNIHIAYACDSCHAVMDGRLQSEYTRDDVKLMAFEGLIRTQQIMIDEGVINL